MDIELVRRQQELSDVWSFYFTRPAGYRYEAGDYAELEFTTGKYAGRRWFTIASAPHEPYLQFTIRIPTPRSDYKKELAGLRPGNSVRISPAIGNFNLPLKPDKLLFIAGGIGITPFRSMIRHAQEHNLDHDIRLLHVARGEHLFRELMETEHNTSRFLDSTSYGRPSIDDIRQLVSDLDTRVVYLAGPEPMMDRLHEAFLAASHPRHRLRLEYFPGYQTL